MEKILKLTLIVIGALVLLIYIFNIDYIFKGVRTIYLTGNNTAFISDYEYFDNREIKSSTALTGVRGTTILDKEILECLRENLLMG